MDQIKIADLMDEVWIAPTHGTDYELPYLEAGLANWRVDTSPLYQRGHVWTEEQRQSFLGYWLQGGKVPTLWVWDPPEIAHLDHHTELIDGKQRLSALLGWWHDEVPANIDGRLIFARDTNRRFRIHHSIHLTFVKLPTRADVIRFYLRLNGGGTPHSPEELARVRKLLEGEGGGKHGNA